MVSCLFVHNKLYYLTITALSLMLVHEHSSIILSVYSIFKLEIVMFMCEAFVCIKDLKRCEVLSACSEWDGTPNDIAIIKRP